MEILGLEAGTGIPRYLDKLFEICGIESMKEMDRLNDLFDSVTENRNT